MKIDVKFPQNFFWGGGISAVQTEGKGKTKTGKTSFDLLYEKYPEKFFDNVGPELTIDFTNKYKEDIDRFASIKLNSFRFSLSWARLFPDGENVDPEAVKLYHDIIDYCKAKNIEPIICLFHFDPPAWAALKGSFESKEVVDKFVKYADFVFNEYGSKIKYFATMNEPSIPSMNGLQSTGHWPAIIDNKRFMQSWWGTILASGKAINLFNKKYKDKFDAVIGVILVFSPVIAKDGKSATKEDKEAAKITELFAHEMWHNPMIKGEIPEEIFKLAKKYDVLWDYNDEEIAEINQVKTQWVGVNFYAPWRVVAWKEKVDINKKGIVFSLAKNYKWEEGRFNVFRGWEIYPQSLYAAAKAVQNNFGNMPFMICENGMGVENEHLYRDKETKEIQDDYRIAYIKEHLFWLNKAIQEGANCFGYHLWSPIDNWSFMNAFKNRYGLFEVDLSTQERRYKKSAYWYKELITHNGFNSNFKKVDEVLDLKKVKFKESKILF